MQLNLASELAIASFSSCIIFDKPKDNVSHLLRRQFWARLVCQEHNFWRAISSTTTLQFIWEYFVHRPMHNQLRQRQQKSEGSGLQRLFSDVVFAFPEEHAIWQLKLLLEIWTSAGRCVQHLRSSYWRPTVTLIELERKATLRVSPLTNQPASLIAHLLPSFRASSANI